MHDDEIMYIGTNKSFPGLVKIGYAADVEKMLERLYQDMMTPYPYQVYATFENPPHYAGNGLRRIIEKLRPELKTDDGEQGSLHDRGFYAITPQEAYQLLEDIAEISGTAEFLHRNPEYEEDKLPEIVQTQGDIKQGKRRKKFLFSMIGLRYGDEIQFKGDPGRTFRVMNDQAVEYNGKAYSLSALAKELTGKAAGPQGTLYFTYRGETLDHMRRRMEKK